jgi:VWA domain containing CoxE-like protein
VRRLLSVLIVIAGLSCATRVRAQEDACLRRVIAASVIGTRGAVFSDLTAANFEASIHHKPVRIVSVIRDESPRRVIVALDAGGSMHDNWKGNIALARSLMESSRPDDEMGLVTFSDRVLDIVPLTRERGPLSVEFAQLSESAEYSPKGLTAVWDALASISEQFGHPQFGDSIFMLSDGQDNRSRIAESKVESMMIGKGIRVFGLALPPGNWGREIREPRAEGQPAAPEINTGGFGVFFSSPPRVDESLPIAADASGRQTVVATARFQLHMIQTVEKIDIELPQRIERPEQWTLSVHGVSDPRLRVVYPHTLRVCSARD